MKEPIKPLQTFALYQLMAARTMNANLDKPATERHALFEMASELGEIHAVYQKRLQGHPFDEANLREEIGDLLWGIAELCTVRGYDMGEIAAQNIEKLKARYPQGFSVERSVERNEP